MAFDLPNPFRKEADTPPPPAPVSGREWGRLYIMGFVLFLVVATMITMKKVTDTLSKAKDRPGPDQVDFKVRDTTGGKPPAPQAQEESPEGPKKAIQVPAPPPEGTLNFRELAVPFRDGEERIVKETPEFINLVSVFLKSVTREGIAGKVAPGLTADAVYRDPAKHRGDVLRVYGRLIQIYTERIAHTNPLNVEFVYLGVMQEYLTNRTVCFYMPEKPLDAATGKPIQFTSYRKGGEEFFSDWVEVDGIFLCQYVYPSKWTDEKGQTIYARAATLFVKDLRLARKPEISDPRGSFVFVVGGLAILVAAIVVMGGVMSRKYSAGSLRMRMHHLRHQKEGAARAAEGEPSKAADPPAPPPPPAAGAPGGTAGGIAAPPPVFEPPPEPPKTG